MRKSLIMIISILLLMLYNSIFIVEEGERGIKFHFNSIVRDFNKKPLIYEPGLHFKIPFFKSVKTIDARIKTINDQVDRFMTKEKKDLIIDSYITWRIKDFSLYFLATGGDILQAEVLLKRKFSDCLRYEISRLSMKDIITDLRSRLTLKIRNALNFGCAITKNEVKTDNVDNTIIKAKKCIQTQTINTSSIVNINNMSTLGIEVVDVRIKHIRLPSKIYEAIYNRMRAEREAISRHHRSQGQAKAERLKAEADYKVTKTLAEAERLGRILRGEGDAEAIKIFADAFRKDPDFYTFIRSLHAYENSFRSNQNVIILSPDNDFFRYIKMPQNEK